MLSRNHASSESCLVKSDKRKSYALSGTLKHLYLHKELYLHKDLCK